jgi:hypothetical protein
MSYHETGSHVHVRSVPVPLDALPCVVASWVFEERVYTVGKKLNFKKSLRGMADGGVKP